MCHVENARNLDGLVSKVDLQVGNVRCPVERLVCLKITALIFLPAASSPETPGSTTTTPDMPGSDRNSIGFLLNCPSDGDFIREFPKDNTLSPPQGNATTTSHNVIPMRNAYEQGMSSGPLPGYHEYEPPSMGSNLESFLSNLEFDNFERQTHNYNIPGENMMMLPSPDGFLDPAALEPRGFQIREKLIYTAQTLQQANLLPKELLDAIENISAANIASWIKLYFRHWHKHGPIVHEATFNPCNAALPLVLALMSLGGMVSPENTLSV